MGNIIVADTNESSGKIYRFSGFSSTILTSFSSPSNGVRDIAVDRAANVLSSDDGVDKLYKHSGQSSTITASFAITTTLACRSIAWDGGDALHDYLYSSGPPYYYIKYVGFSSTIRTSYANGAAQTRGLGWDGTNLLFVTPSNDDGGIGKLYRATGFTSTIESSFSAPYGSPRAVSWDGTNILCDDNSATTNGKVFMMTGYSSTVSSSFSTPSIAPIGIVDELFTGGAASQTITITNNDTYKTKDAVAIL